MHLSGDDVHRTQLTFEIMVPAADWALACAFPHPNHFASSGAARPLCGQARERAPPSRGGRRGPSFRGREGASICSSPSHYVRSRLMSTVPPDFNGHVSPSAGLLVVKHAAHGPQGGIKRRGVRYEDV